MDFGHEDFDKGQAPAKTSSHRIRYQGFMRQVRG
jgi:hypothetical protein